MYTIIEDCSPYYIRFTFDKIKNIISFVLEQTTVDVKKYGGYTHNTIVFKTSEKIISMLPMSTQIDFETRRVAIFDTPPGGGCGIHKDGVDTRMSINLTLQILDDECTTFWYEDKLFENQPLCGSLNYTRNIYQNYETMNKFQPIKTMVAKPNEMILFNTDIYHSWNNINSSNHRKILTLRAQNFKSVYFDDAKKILFDI
jgi:hypothetical protein